MKATRPKRNGTSTSALALYERIHRIDNMAVSHERLASVSEGAERAAHVQAAREAWLSINLTAQAERISQRLPEPRCGQGRGQSTRSRRSRHLGSSL